MMVALGFLMGLGCGVGGVMLYAWLAWGRI